MALIMQYCRYLHTPKTGGMWVHRAIANSGITHAALECELEHVNLHSCPGRGMFTIAFVRYPWSWWKSYWVFKQMAGWDEKLPLDATCASDNFEQFLLRVLEHHPGYCSQVFQLYVGPPDLEIEFIGRFERLADDLIRALETAGEKFDETAIRETPPTNVGNYQRFRTRCSTEIRQRILAAEYVALERFGYFGSSD